VYSICLAYTAEYLRKRYLFCMVGFCTIVVGLIVEIAQPPAPGVRYMGLFFMTAGAYLVMPLSVVWIAINVGKGYKRSIALGTIISVGNVGSFISTNVFLKREEPRFPYRLQHEFSIVLYGNGGSYGTVWRHVHGEQAV
jgi:surface polysaccharide O-acyltransferase-like enzyme